MMRVFVPKYMDNFKGISTDHMIELNQKEKERIFNLGYYTGLNNKVLICRIRKEKRSKFLLEHYNNLLFLINQLTSEFTLNVIKI